MSEYRKLDPEVKASWLRALRSGRYKRTGGVLNRRRGNRSRWVGKDARQAGYCCLGVLTDLYQKANNNPLVEIEEANGCVNYTVPGSTVYNGTLPPHVVLQWAGLDTMAMSKLTGMNDGYGIKDDGTGRRRGLSFREIANWIEKHL